MGDVEQQQCADLVGDLLERFGIEATRVGGRAGDDHLRAVLEGERLVGVFSERDVVRRVLNRGRDPLCTAVGDVMTTNLVVAGPDEDYQAAMRTMDYANIRHLPVVEDGRMVSMLSIRDLMRVDTARLTEEIRYLHEYMYQVPH